jgi:hypothetical protein
METDQHQALPEYAWACPARGKREVPGLYRVKIAFYVRQYRRNIHSAYQSREANMKQMALAVFVASVFVAGAHAQGASCKAQAGEKKLAGAALNSFMQKCERDAKSACDKQASDRKLAGAAKNSFTTKCVTDSVGS